jgi:bifunctional UDP-N-acetylglucosamine pyrophosphorylase/glucosamine-1-phosphate N-acetyltransferase
MVEATQPTRAIVLAGGQGKRMKSNLPKVLHEVLGMPILARLLGTIDLLNLEHIHVVVGHQSEQIKEFLSKLSLHTPISLHLQEPQLGTARRTAFQPPHERSAGNHFDNRFGRSQKLRTDRAR